MLRICFKIPDNGCITITHRQCILVVCVPVHFAGLRCCERDISSVYYRAYNCTVCKFPLWQTKAWICKDILWFPSLMLITPSCRIFIVQLVSYTTMRLIVNHVCHCCEVFHFSKASSYRIFFYPHPSKSIVAGGNIVDFMNHIVMLEIVCFIKSLYAAGLQ